LEPKKYVWHENMAIKKEDNTSTMRMLVSLDHIKRDSAQE